jgi:hypothetical protein
VTSVPVAVALFVYGPATAVYGFTPADV